MIQIGKAANTPALPNIALQALLRDVPEVPTNLSCHESKQKRQQKMDKRAMPIYTEDEVVRPVRPTLKEILLQGGCFFPSCF